MRKKTAVLTVQEELRLDLTLHKMPVAVLKEFAEKIVHPYYDGNLSAALQELMYKALDEQDFVLSHITHVKAAKMV